MGKSILSRQEQYDGLPPWMAKMRQAMADLVKEDDIKEIVQKQIERAKAGDQNAIKFVFGQLLGGEAFKGATFIQNNNYGEGGGAPAAPTAALPGSVEKLEKIRRRVEAGLPANDPRDRQDVDLR